MLRPFLFQEDQDQISTQCYLSVMISITNLDLTLTFSQKYPPDPIKKDGHLRCTCPLSNPNLPQCDPITCPLPSSVVWKHRTCSLFFFLPKLSHLPIFLICSFCYVDITISHLEAEYPPCWCFLPFLHSALYLPNSQDKLLSFPIPFTHSEGRPNHNLSRFIFGSWMLSPTSCDPHIP